MSLRWFSSFIVFSLVFGSSALSEAANEQEELFFRGAHRLAGALDLQQEGETAQGLKLLSAEALEAFPCETLLLRARFERELKHTALALKEVQSLEAQKGCSLPLQTQALELGFRLAEELEARESAENYLRAWLQLRGAEYEKVLKQVEGGATSLHIQRILREDGALLAPLRLRQASFLRARGQEKEAVALEESLALRFPQTTEGKKSKVPAGASDEARYLRARIFAALGQYEEATSELEALAKETNSQKIQFQSLLEVGKMMERWRQGERSARALELVLDKASPESPEAREASYLAARTYYRRVKSKRSRALPLLESLDREGVPESLRGDAMDFRIGILLEYKRVTQAMELMEREGSREGSTIQESSLTKLGWRYYRAGNWKDALRIYRKLLKVPDLTATRATALFWAGRCLEKLGQEKEARDMFREAATVFPLHYYGTRARLRLPDDWKADLEGVPAPERVQKFNAQELPPASKMRVAALVKSELYEMGMWELQDLLERDAGNLQALALLARLAALQGEFEQSLVWGNQGFGALRYYRPGLVPPHLLRLLYPMPYGKELLAACRGKNVSPALVAGLIHQESGFFATVVSGAGAVGLMQLMPATARNAARRLGMKFQDDMLTDPEVNLKLGVDEFSRSLAGFGGNPVPALIAYNAGPGKARDWWASISHQDLELFVERVPYKETRRYIQRILGKAAAYESLYPDLKE